MLSRSRIVLPAMLLVFATACGGGEDAELQDEALAEAEAEAAPAAVPAAAAEPAGPPVEHGYAGGEATFEFEGSTRTWPLAEGRFVRTSEDGMMSEVINLRYGDREARGDGLLTVLLSRYHMEGMGEPRWGVGELGVARSSRSSRLRPGLSGCDVQVTEVSESVVRGTVECPPEFMGPPVGKVAFTATR